MPAVRGALRGSRSRGADSGRSGRGSWCAECSRGAERASASGVGPGAHKLPQSDRFHAGGKGVNPFPPAFFMFACGGLKLPTNVQCERFHARARGRLPPARACGRTLLRASSRLPSTSSRAHPNAAFPRKRAASTGFECSAPTPRRVQKSNVCPSTARCRQAFARAHFMG